MTGHRKKYYFLILNLFLFIAAYSLQSERALAASVTADGTEHTHIGNIEADENGACGGTAINGGVLHLSGDIHINADNAMGARSNKGSALYISGDVEVSGKHSVGIYASDDASVTVSGDIKTVGQSTTAAYADKNSGLVISGNVSASGSGTTGIFAYGGSRVELYGNVEAEGNSAYGARSMGQNSMLYISGDINVNDALGSFAYGLSVQNGAKSEMRGNISVNNAYQGYGVDVEFWGSHADVYGNVSVTGERARGAFAYDYATLYMEGDIYVSGTGSIAAGTEADAVLDLHGNIVVANSNGSRGASANLGSETNVSGDITVSGSGSSAVYADQKSIVNISGDITISGSASLSVSRGVHAVRDSTINVSGDIEALGAGAQGVYASASTVNISGDISAVSKGVYALSSSTVNVSGDIMVSGSGARGIDANASTVNISGDIGVSGTSATAVYARSSDVYIKNSVINVDSATGSGIDTGTGSSIFLDKAVINAGSAIVTSSYASIVAGNSTHINGDVANKTSSSSYDGKTLDISLSGASSLTGSVNDTGSRGVTNITLTGAKDLWRVSGDSNIKGTLINNGEVYYSPSQTLTKITLQNLKSDVSGAGFTMNVSVADEDSDKLIITGTAEGSYILNISGSTAVNPRGGEVFTLVETARDQDVSFTLGHEVEFGAWQYALRHVVDYETSFGLLDGEAWQLYGTGNSSNVGDAAINSFAGSYLLAYAETQTLIQRLGDLRETPLASGLWFRIHGGKYESKAKNYVKDLDMDYGGAQIGYDHKVEMSWDGSASAGIMFGYSRGNLDYAYGGSGKVDSKTVGVYGVWTQPNGFFADLVLKYQWMKNDFDILDTADRKVTGSGVNTGGLGASLEIGRRIPFGKEQKGGWYIEPQLQLSYQRQDGGYFTASNGIHIGIEPFTSVLARIGMLIGYETEKSNFYAKVSKVREFDGDLTIVASHDEHIHESFGGSWWVCGIGYTSKINDRHSLYFDLERAGGGGFSQPWRLTAGWRQTF